MKRLASSVRSHTNNSSARSVDTQAKRVVHDREKVELVDRIASNVAHAPKIG
jgi:hypothetical protein